VVLTQVFFNTIFILYFQFAILFAERYPHDGQHRMLATLMLPVPPAIVMECLNCNGSGTDIWDNQDGFQFAYKTFVGDGEIKARIVVMDNQVPGINAVLCSVKVLLRDQKNSCMALTQW